MDYYEIPRLSNSGLTAFKREVEGLPSFFAKESTLEFGRLFHTALYEADKLDKEELNRLSVSDQRTLFRMMIEARKSAIVRFFIQHPEAEVEKAVFFDLYGVPFKMKADVLIASRKSGHDAKTTSCTSLDAFLATFDEYGYWRQAEIYRQGAGLKKFYFTGVSKLGQHNTFTVDVSKHADKMREAKKEVRELVHLWKKKNENSLPRH